MSRAMTVKATAKAAPAAKTVAPAAKPQQLAKAEVAEVAEVNAPVVAPLEAASLAPATLAPAADFARFVAAAREAKPTKFHVSGSIQRDQLLTAEIDGLVGDAGVSLVVTDSNVPGATGMAANLDEALKYKDLAPLLAAVPAGNLDQALALAASHVTGEEIVQRDGETVAMFTLADHDLKVGFPVSGALKTYVEGADHLSLVVSAN
jgi:hypothetical protein